MRRFSRILGALMLSAATLAAQSGEIAPGDNLVVEGIPKIPAVLVEEVSRYTEFRSAGLSSWHPMKREMLINTRFGDTGQVHLVKFPGGARSQLTFFADPAGRASFEPSRGEYFIFGKATGGNEINQGYRYDLATGKITMFTDGRSRHTGSRWANAGNRGVYGRLRPSKEGIFLEFHVVDPSDPKSDRLLAEQKGAGWAVLDWSPDDSKLLVAEFISINETYLWLMDANSGEKTLLTPKGGPEKVAYLGGRFSKDGKGIYLTTDRDSEFQRLGYLDLAAGKHTFLTDHIKWDVEDFELSPDGKLIAFVVNEDGAGVLHLLDTASGREKPAPRLPLGTVFNLHWHKNGRDLGFNLTSARTPADVYSVDIKTGKVERWTYSETSGLNTDNFAEPERIHWKSFDGRTISGFLYRPPAKPAGKLPVVVNIHGGPEGQFRPGFLGRNNYFLNEMGVAVLFPNIRGSAGYGKTFLTLDNIFLREDSYKDIGALLDWIKAQAGLDGERIMVTGGSYGGHMTLVTATRYNDKIRCSLDEVGMSNLRTFLENTEAFRRDLRRVEYGDERDPKVREFLERIAPLNNAQKITKPLFVIQGKNDPRTPLTEAEQMVATVRKNATPVWYLMAKDEGHGFSKKKNVDFQFYATVLFMRENLLK